MRNNHVPRTITVIISGMLAQRLEIILSSARPGRLDFRRGCPKLRRLANRSELFRVPRRGFEGKPQRTGRRAARRNRWKSANVARKFEFERNEEREEPE